MTRVATPSTTVAVPSSVVPSWKETAPETVGSPGEVTETLAVRAVPRGVVAAAREVLVVVGTTPKSPRWPASSGRRRSSPP